MKIVARGIYVQGCARSGTSLLRELCGASFKDVETAKIDQHSSECSLEHLARLLQVASRDGVVMVASRDYDCSLSMNVNLLRANPWIKVLWMLRDPRDVLTSVHVGKPGKYYVTPERWLNCFALYRQFKDESQVLIIRYEELVHNPEIMQERIADFCKLSAKRNFGEAYKFFPQFQENIRSMHSIRPIDENSVQKWQRNSTYRDYLRQLFAKYPEIPVLAREYGYEIEAL